MRILLTADPELPVPPKLYGGIERIVASLGAGLASRGHKVALAAHRDSDRNAGLQLFPWPGLRSQNRRDALTNLMALQFAAADFKPDLVHSFSRLLYLGPLLLRRRLPKVMSYQREPSGRTVCWASKLAGHSMVFTGCSEVISAHGRQQGGGHWETIHNFVELDRFQFSPHVPEDAPLVFLSRIEEQKGAHIAIDTAKRTGRRLLLAGNHSATPGDVTYWKDAIEPELGRNGIEYIGTVNDEQKNALLGSAVAMIVPVQWDEPFGIVFAEALACGTPVISCPRGALPEIVREEIDGFLIRSVEEAVAAVKRIPDLRRADCRQRAETCFSSEAVVAKYESLYQRVSKPS